MMINRFNLAAGLFMVAVFTGCVSTEIEQPGNVAIEPPAEGATTTKKETIKMQDNIQKVKIETSMGVMTAELYADKAPVTVKNFLSYVDKGFYDGTIFHRVISGFMIQGGGFTPDMRQKATDNPIKNEADNKLGNSRGTLSMARTMVVDSATCQFFINHKDNPSLDYKSSTPQGYGYCVFGKVVEGLDVLDKIAAVQTGRHPSGHADVPRETVLIKSIKRID